MNQIRPSYLVSNPNYKISKDGHSIDFRNGEEIISHMITGLTPFQAEMFEAHLNLAIEIGTRNGLLMAGKIQGGNNQ